MAITRTCGWCGVRCNMKVHQEPAVISTESWGGVQTVQIVFQCDGCKRISLAKGTRSSLGAPVTGTRLLVDETPWLPEHREKRSYEDVPDPMGDMASEAHACLAVGASRGAVALARAVVEATAKAKGITTGSLQKKIDRLFEEQFIREHVRDAAHEVRFGGNEVAHGDLVSEPITPAVATEILSLMDEILEEVFESPARVARRKQERLEREARQKAGGTEPEGDTVAPSPFPRQELVRVEHDDAPPF